MSTSLVNENAAYEVVEGEPPELLSRNLVSAGHLLASATAFFFLAFVFAFFYLRSLNNAHMWKPKGVDTSVAWGTVVVVCYVLSALLVRAGFADDRAGRYAAWRTKGFAALGFGVAGLVVQAIAWTHQGFGPADGGFASVYFGWTAFLFLFVLGTLFWLETTIAMAWRYRGQAGSVPAGHASGDPDRPGADIRDPVSLVRAELAALSFYWTFLAGIAVLTWVVLYLL
jgi:heme/copper-type cytochrome/quinol oxidase subunit 3